jgi:hypothetical protein
MSSENIPRSGQWTVFVVASSPEMAAKNRNNMLMRFDSAEDAWREMANAPRIYPVVGGFGVFKVEMAVEECERPMTDEENNGDSASA